MNTEVLETVKEDIKEDAETLEKLRADITALQSTLGDILKQFEHLKLSLVRQASELKKEVVSEAVAVEAAVVRAAYWSCISLKK